METEEVDLFVVIEKLWRRKKVVFAWMGGCLAVGIVLIFLLPRQYKAECMMQWRLPEGSQQLSPSLYPDLFNSDAFRQQLIHRPLYVDETGDTVTYFTALVGKKPVAAAYADSDVATLSTEERMCIGCVGSEVSVALNIPDRLVTVSATSHNPKMAALLADQARQLLQHSVCEEGGKMCRKAFAVIEKRYYKMKEELRLRRQQLVESLEHAATLSAVRREVERKILMEDYDLFYTLYSDCVCEYEEMRAKLQEGNPVLTVVKPVVEPAAPYKPRPRMLVLASLFIGFLLGCGHILLKQK